jgi:CheY-like chemotaxis protein
LQPIGFNDAIAAKELFRPGSREQNRAMSRQVLLVEDDPELLGSLASFLQEEGYQVECARHGLEALGRLRGGCRPDVILLDLMMPIMTGWEFRDAQRRDSDLCRIPVVVVSGMEDSERHAAFLEADGYVQKPIPAETLISTLNRYCD